MSPPPAGWGMLPQSKVVAMIEEENGQPLEPFQCLYNYDNMMTRACARLGQISDSERVMGYKESAEMYVAMVIELKAQRAWWHEVFMDSIKSGPDLSEKAVITETVLRMLDGN